MLNIPTILGKLITPKINSFHKNFKKNFRSNLIEFKRSSASAVEFQKAEEVNQKMKILSNDLRILLSLLEFEESELKMCLGLDEYNWINFIIQWKYQG